MKEVYRVADALEMQDLGFSSEEYEDKILIGPNGFYCSLGESEGVTWSKDGIEVVEELNRLYELFTAAVENV